MTQPQLNQLSPHVHWLAPDGRTDRPTLGVIAGSKATLIVDAGNSLAHAHLLLNAMVEAKLGKPSYVIFTHWHWDHVFGAAAFDGEDSDATIFAHQEIQRHVEEMVHLDWSDEALDKRVEEGSEIEFCRDMIKVELPDRTDLQIKPADITFASELVFDLGDIHCQVKHVGGDHSSDSCVVYAPEGKVLFLSDCLYENLHHGPHHYTTQKLFPLLDEIARFDADHYVWGHHDRPMPKAEMQAFMAKLRTIGNVVDQVGHNRASILQELQGKIDDAIDGEDIEIIDAFLAGL